MKPQGSLESFIPRGWVFYSADFSLLVSGHGLGSVMIRRDKEGTECWHSLSDAEKERVQLYVTGVGRSVGEALQNAVEQINT